MTKTSILQRYNSSFKMEMCDQDRVHLTNIDQYFPDLVWGKVMDKMKKKDIENCWKASTYFGKLLQQKRESVVLPQVFGILLKRYADKNNLDESYKETNVNSIPWNRPSTSIKTHRLTGILKCRLVSKSWNEAIEKCFEEKYHVGDNARTLTRLLSHRFDDNSLPQPFLEHFEKTHYGSSTAADEYVGLQREINPIKNPFLGRSIQINYDDDADNLSVQNFQNGCLEILRKYGQYIRYLDLEYSTEYNVQIDQFYRKIAELVHFTPNLKTLRVSHHTFDRPVPLAHLPALEQEISNNPFPKLATLASLKFSYLPIAMFRQILHQNLHIKRLEISREHDHDQDYPVFVEVLPNLRELSIHIGSVGDFEEFENCRFPLNLEKLGIRFQSNITPFIPWSRVFSALESKLNNELCTQLDTELPRPRTPIEKESVLRDSLAYRLNFPKLTTFTIWNRMPFCLDFLLPSRNTLSEINVYEWVDSGNHQIFENEQVIKFLGYRNNIQHSNIHTEFPRVKTLSVIDCFDKTCYRFENNGVVRIIKRRRKLKFK